MTRSNNSTNGLNKYGKLLRAKRSNLLSGFRGKLDTLVSPTSAAMEDLAPASHEQLITLQINHLDCLQLKLIDAALKRMDLGTYGFCLD